MTYGGEGSFIITCNLTNINSSNTNYTIVEMGDWTTVLSTVSNLYALPTSISVTGATYSYNSTTGALTLSNATSNVTITAVAVRVIPERTVSLRNLNTFKEEIEAEIDTKANTSDLSTVATSGSYNDLTNKPTIPTFSVSATEVTGATEAKSFTVNGVDWNLPAGGGSTNAVEKSASSYQRVTNTGSSDTVLEFNSSHASAVDVGFFYNNGTTAGYYGFTGTTPTVWRGSGDPETIATTSAENTFTSLNTFKNTIFAYAYNTSNNIPAIRLDKPGSNYAGIGSHNLQNTIWFGCCSAQNAWIDDYYQTWHFNGHIEATGGGENILTISNPTGGVSGLKMSRATNTAWTMYVDGGNLYLKDNNTGTIGLYIPEYSQGHNGQIYGNTILTTGNFYVHLIHMHYGSDNLEMRIVSMGSTPFADASLKSWLYQKGFRSYSSLYPVTGAMILSNGHLVAAGICSSSGYDLRVYGLRTYNNSRDYYSPTFDSDTVISL